MPFRIVMPRLVAVVLAFLVLPALPAAADHDGTHVPTTDFLPPVQSDEPAADRSEQCGADGLVCVQFVEDELARWESFFACDHRAVFPTVYRLLTRETRFQLEDDPSFFVDPAGLGWEALLFYELYLEMITAHLAGETIPPAWETAMGAAQEGDWTAGHDMLLAINAHVQRDMPFAVAGAGITMPNGESRKGDHDRFNAILSRAYDVIVPEIAARYDPFMGSVDDTGGPAEDIGAQQLVAYWRERVWRNAEDVVAFDGTPLFDVKVAAIEGEAERWAEQMLVGEIPGHREARDAYCLAQAAARGDDVAASPIPQPSPPADTPVPTVDGQPEGELAATGGGAALGALGLLLLLGAVRRRR